MGLLRNNEKLLDQCKNYFDEKKGLDKEILGLERKLKERQELVEKVEKCSPRSEGVNLNDDIVDDKEIRNDQTFMLLDQNFLEDLENSYHHLQNNLSSEKNKPSHLTANVLIQAIIDQNSKIKEELAATKL